MKPWSEVSYTPGGGGQPSRIGTPPFAQARSHRPVRISQAWLSMGFWPMKGEPIAMSVRPSPSRSPAGSMVKPTRW